SSFPCASARWPCAAGRLTTMHTLACRPWLPARQVLTESGFVRRLVAGLFRASPGGAAPLGPGVCPVVHGGQVLEVKLGVGLCRGDIGVAEQVLHGAKVLGGLQQVAGKTVAQHVWMHVHGQPRLCGQCLQLLLYNAWMNACSPYAQEQCGAI